MDLELLQLSLVWSDGSAAIRPLRGARSRASSRQFLSTRGPRGARSRGPRCPRLSYFDPRATRSLPVSKNQLNVIQWKRPLLSPKKAMRRLRSMHFASAHETSPSAARADATAAAASWALTTAATAATSAVRIICRAKPSGGQKKWRWSVLSEWSYGGRACRRSRSVIKMNGLCVIRLPRRATRGKCGTM